MLRVYNVTDLPGYGPPRTCVVNKVPVHPGRSHPFEKIHLPLNRKVQEMTPRTSGVVVLDEGAPLPPVIQAAYAKMRAQPAVKAEIPAPVLELPPKGKPDHSARDAWLKERTFSVLKAGYAVVVGRVYSGSRGQKKVLAALHRDADEQKLTSWVETSDG
jgi:hypothetical protein